jgi:hypothetical protein
MILLGALKQYNLLIYMNLLLLNLNPCASSLLDFLISSEKTTDIISKRKKGTSKKCLLLSQQA